MGHFGPTEKRKPGSAKL